MFAGDGDLVALRMPVPKVVRMGLPNGQEPFTVFSILLGVARSISGRMHLYPRQWSRQIYRIRDMRTYIIFGRLVKGSRQSSCTTQEDDWYIRIICVEPDVFREFTKQDNRFIFGQRRVPASLLMRWFYLGHVRGLRKAELERLELLEAV